MGILITQLLPEIQLTVNSDPTKYDPNGNEQIDDGSELSTLLSEYNVKNPKELTIENCPLVELKSRQEVVDMDKRQWDHYTNSPTKQLFAGAEVLTAGVGAFALFMGAFPAAAICGGIALVAHLIHKEIARDDAYDAIKAEQADQAETIRANRRKAEEERKAKEEELKAREEAMKKQELEYRQNLEKTTSNIDKNVRRANTNATKLNQTIENMNNKVQPVTTDSIK